MILRLAVILVSVLLAMMGAYLFAFGGTWAPLALEILPDTEFGFWLELIVPFLPMAFIGFAAVLFVSGQR